MSRDDIAKTTGPAAPDSQVVGAYLACALNPGDTLDASDLLPAPLFVVSKGRSPYLIPIADEPGLRTILDVGSHVDVWRGFRPVLSDVPVLAVLCRDEADARCAVAIEVTDKDRTALARPDTGSLHLLVRRINP